MGRAYSQDLRDRVIDAVEKDGMSCRAAAGRFGVSESSAIKWLRRYRKTGQRTPVGTGGHRPSVLAPHLGLIEAVRLQQPDITLQALCDRLAAERGVKADTGMMSRFFRRQAITMKKDADGLRARPAGRSSPARPVAQIPRPHRSGPAGLHR